MKLALRTIAVLIAVASVVDPAWSVSRPEPKRVTVIDLATGEAEASIAAVRTALPDWEITARSGDSRSIPCARDERCVVVADGSISAPFPADLREAPVLIAARRADAANLKLRSVTAASGHVAAAGSLRVDMQRSGVIPETVLVVRDGTAVVGSATYKWGEGDATASVDVPWWPLDAGARTLRVEARAFDGETITVDNVLDVGVAVRADRVPVLVFDARPSWNSTFVRRALEDDPRIDVEYRSRLAPSVSAGTRNGTLDAATLEAAQAVVIGDPDALTVADAALLDRFVRARGGSLILLPDRRVSGPAARWLTGDWTEHLLPAPEPVGPLRSSELLRADKLPVTAKVLAHSGAASSIVSLPFGYGRVIVSGAMDAWRYRDQGAGIGDQGAFDRFWRSVVIEAALAGSTLRVDIDSTLAAARTRVPFTVRWTSFEPRTAVEVAVSAGCGDEAREPVRVWPSGAVNAFTGTLAVTDAACELQATAGDRVQTAYLAVAADPSRGVDATLAELERSVRAAGGTAYAVGDEAALARRFAAGFAPTSRIVSVRPMHSLWWMLPFAGCLSIEWFLRRRHGLR